MLHISLSFILLIGSAGLVVNKHYCRDQLKSTALFLKAKACHQKKQPACPMHAATDEHSGPGESRDCCDDQSEYLKAKDEQLLTSTDFTLQRPLTPMVMPSWLPLAVPGGMDRQTLHYLNYKPPLIVCDRQIILQTFLC